MFTNSGAVTEIYPIFLIIKLVGKGLTDPYMISRSNCQLSNSSISNNNKLLKRSRPLGARDYDTSPPFSIVFLCAELTGSVMLAKYEPAEV